MLSFYLLVILNCIVLFLIVYVAIIFFFNDSKDSLRVCTSLSLLLFASFLVFDITSLVFHYYPQDSFYPLIEKFFNWITLYKLQKQNFQMYFIASFYLMTFYLLTILEAKNVIIWVQTFSNPFIKKAYKKTFINYYFFFCIVIWFLYLLYFDFSFTPISMASVSFGANIGYYLFIILLIIHFCSLEFLKHRKKILCLLISNFVTIIYISVCNAMKFDNTRMEKQIPLSKILTFLISISSILKLYNIRFCSSTLLKSINDYSPQSISEQLIINRDSLLSELNTTQLNFSDIIGNYFSFHLMKNLLKGIIHIAENNHNNALSKKTKTMITDIDFHNFIYENEALSKIISKRIRKKCCCNCFSFCCQKNINIKEYAPEVFHNIRIINNITSDTLIHSLDIDLNNSHLKNCFVSEGKSKEIFMKNYDNKFLIKSISKKEKDSLLSFLEKYYDYLYENKYSFLCKIYGLYTITYARAEVTFILMENSIPSNNVIYKFDLKGSTFGRNTDKLFDNIHTKTLKDNDFIIIQKRNKEPLVQLSPDDIYYIMNVIKEDTYLLTKANLMDYSLLIGITENDNDSTNETKFISKDKKYVYYISIIDYLTNYGKAKSIETLFKSIKANKNAISSVNPSLYSLRFIKFLRNSVFI